MRVLCDTPVRDTRKRPPAPVVVGGPRVVYLQLDIKGEAGFQLHSRLYNITTMILYEFICLIFTVAFGWYPTGPIAVIALAGMVAARHRNGLRFPMYPTYIGCVVLVSHIIPQGPFVPDYTYKWIMAPLALVTIVLNILLPVPSLPKPTGPFKLIGHAHEVVSKRGVEFVLRVYFPAQKLTLTGEKRRYRYRSKYQPKRIPYPYNGKYTIQGHARFVKMPAVFMEGIGLVKPEAFENVELLQPKEKDLNKGFMIDGKFPLVVLSHGLGSSVDSSTSFIQELVSQVCVSSCPPHTEAVVYMPAVFCFPGVRGRGSWWRLWSTPMAAAPTPCLMTTPLWGTSH